MPAPDLFPFKRLEIDVADPSLGFDSTSRLALEGPRLHEALQYSSSWGLERLVNQLKGLMSREHGKVPEALMVSSGSQESLAKAFEMLIDRGTSILVEEPTYSGALAALRPLGANLLPVPLDLEGPSIAAFEEKIVASRQQGRPVRIFYTIPTGQNPSGNSTSERRRSELYGLCQKHDILILEDDRTPLELLL